MKVKELISILQDMDGEKDIGMMVGGEFRTIDPLIGVGEWKDAVQLQYEVKIPKNDFLKGVNKLIIKEGSEWF